MISIALEEAGTELADMAARVEGGETIVMTRGGEPVVDLAPRQNPRGGFDVEAGEAFLRAKGIVRTPGFIADDFDDPPPEDFLIRPLPEP